MIKIYNHVAHIMPLEYVIAFVMLYRTFNMRKRRIIFVIKCHLIGLTNRTHLLETMTAEIYQPTCINQLNLC